MTPDRRWALQGGWGTGAAAAVEDVAGLALLLDGEGVGGQ